MFATRINRLTSSLVRDILAAASLPGIISFAGGLPASEALFKADQNVLSQLPDDIWQYGQTEGEPALRQQVALRAKAMDARAWAWLLDIVAEYSAYIGHIY
ncbi:hypothetical protein [Iodobacter fluviatilis]|uniref:Uncharacterized protein n=1 Tax=Iodobacter fluviatilis TaxID=537 RepID=A0A7G3GDG1_9NEIS|nr:hypothetical protein [Iodobacter fluviatilis]QBC45361.1 hypothetical protein C1H71_18670 [Iodobacter fluviatilis]